MVNRFQTREFIAITVSLVVILSESGTYGESLESLQNLTAKSNEEKEPVIINTCCPIDLSNTEVKCKSISSEENFISSSTLVMPAHLMAENSTFLFEWVIFGIQW